MEQHDQIAPDVFRTGFSNGSEIIVNYGDTAFSYKDETIQPMQDRLYR